MTSLTEIPDLIEALHARVRELAIESSRYCAEISLGKAHQIQLQLALDAEQQAADLYARQVNHWIGKHDALLKEVEKLRIHAEYYRHIRDQAEVGSVKTDLPLYRVYHWHGYESAPGRTFDECVAADIRNYNE
jgi:hypothetical protein